MSTSRCPQCGAILPPRGPTTRCARCGEQLVSPKPATPFVAIILATCIAGVFLVGIVAGCISIFSAINTATTPTQAPDNAMCPVCFSTFNVPDLDRMTQGQKHATTRRCPHCGERSQTALLEQLFNGGKR